MNRLLLGVCFIFLYSFSYSQNLFRVLRPVFRKPVPIRHGVYIQRVTVVETRQLENAVRAAALQSQYRQQAEMVKQDMFVHPNIPVAYLTQEIKQLDCKPENLYGGYNYLRVCATQLKGANWNRVNSTTSYNGVHHIVAVSTLKELHKECIKSYNNGDIQIYPFFNDLVRNAPGIFIKYHNNPALADSLHNAELQMELYNSGGIKSILDFFFEVVQKQNIKMGIEPIPQDIITGTYVEAELWAKYFGLVWEK